MKPNRLRQFVTLIGLSLTGLSFFGLPTSAADCFPSEELIGIKQDIETLIEISGDCQSNADCLILDATCEFGCDTALNRGGVSPALEALNSYQQLLCEPCIATCSSNWRAICVDGQCQAVRAISEQEELPTTAALDQSDTATSTPTSTSPARPRSKFGRSKFAMPSTLLQDDRNQTATSSVIVKGNQTASSTPR